MLKRFALVLCLQTIMFAAAHAADCKPDSSTQTDMDICAGEAFRTADAQLNVRYKEIVACLKDAAKPLAEAQRAWVKFRDAECAFQAGRREDGGSAWPMVWAGCLQSVTEERNKELDYYLTCREGDLSCPTFTCKFPKRDVEPAAKSR